MSKYDTRKFFERLILEAGEAQDQAQMPQASPQAPQQPPSSGNEAFRSLQGQTIQSVSFEPNGTNGGTIKIKVKNSYVPFTISWVNQTVSVVDFQGNSMVLGDNNQ